MFASANQSRWFVPFRRTSKRATPHARAPVERYMSGDRDARVDSRSRLLRGGRLKRGPTRQERSTGRRLAPSWAASWPERSRMFKTGSPPFIRNPMERNRLRSCSAGGIICLLRSGRIAYSFELGEIGAAWARIGAPRTTRHLSVDPTGSSSSDAGYSAHRS